MASKRLLASQLWRRVHPDLFARWPSARVANERSMQNLRALLDAAEEHSSALRTGAAPPRSHPPRQQVKFFVVRDEDAADPLEEIAAVWRPPGLGASRHTAAQGDAWLRSAEGVVASLLRQADPYGETEPGDEPTARPARSAATGHDEGMVRTAAAADRRRRDAARHSASNAGGETQHAESSSADTRCGGALRTELLFFHGVAADERARATARLSDLVRDSIAAHEAHGPILLCAGPPPSKAARRGFAVISLDASVDDLRSSLARAARSAAGVSAAARRTATEEALAASRQLRTALGCEQVRLRDAIDSDEAADMCGILQADSQALRSALEVPWRGLFLDLLSARQTSTDVEFVDAPCGGGTLRLRGEFGAAGALEHVRSGWRGIRLVQERYALAAKLTERLGCRAVHAFGAPHSTEAQCESMRRLLRLLSVQSVLLDRADEPQLSAFALTIGDAPPGADAVEEVAEEERALRQASLAGAQRSGRGVARPIPRMLTLPVDFDTNEALELLIDAAHPRRRGPPRSSPHSGAGRSRAMRRYGIKYR